MNPAAYGKGEYIDGQRPWWRFSIEDNLASMRSSKQGLSDADAQSRLAEHGKNRIQSSVRLHIFREFLLRFYNPLSLLLLFACAISAATGQTVSAGIIALMVLLGTALDVIQQRRAENAAERLQQSVALRATVLRDGTEKEIDAQNLVPGDIVMLRAGQLVPADGRVLASRDCFVKQAALTGEAYPVEKSPRAIPESDDLHQAENALFMGSSVVTGQANMLVCATGAHTQIGHVAGALAMHREKTAFEQDIRQFGQLILRVTMALTAFVLIVNLLADRPVLESFMFALALAVGLTPELLPMVVTVTLTRGALRLSAQHVIVKRLSAIHDMGAIDVLCTDKTGTLTEGSIRLEQHLDIHGRDNETVLRYAWLNCFFESGIRTALEEAVLSHVSMRPDGWTKIDEVPFDFERRRLSVLLAEQRDSGERRWLILKGAPDDVLTHCTSVCETPSPDGCPATPLDEPTRGIAQQSLRSLESAGFRTLAIAIKEMPADREHASLDDETGLILIGLLAFLDPPKDSAAHAIKKLKRQGIGIKIITGDSELVTQHICASLGMPVTGILMGHEIARMDDTTLRRQVESANLFCRTDPMQKNRVILALKANGHTVGYLGDGINDAPGLHNADVGISVDTAVDVAKEAADLILLRHDLDVLARGVLEGRRTFCNVRKYIMMGTSSNFGNMFSMAGAALFLPFLPMQPVQILLNNILYDLSCSVIPLDTVDAQELMTPQKWDVRFFRDFMLTMGPVSSLFDFLTFYLLLAALHASEPLFQSGWFVESLATQVLVIFIIRTRFSPFANRPHAVLAMTAVVIVGIGALLPLLPWGMHFGLVPIPVWFYGVLAGLMIAYLMTAQLVKMLFYKWHDNHDPGRLYPRPG